MLNFNLAQFTAAYGTAKQLPEPDGPEFVFCGRSNVGKSSLINKIVNRKALARTSSVPGKTATINFYTVDSVFFVDLPGYGFAKAAKTEKERWNSLIKGYFDCDRDFALIIQLMDARHKPSEFDKIMVNYLVESELPFVVALTKADKLSKTARKKCTDEFKSSLEYGDQIKFIPFSSMTGEGADELRAIINDVSGRNGE